MCSPNAIVSEENGMEKITEDKINLSVLTAAGTVYEKNVGYVNIPTDFGSVGILKGHAPMFCAVGKGVVRCTFELDKCAKIAVGEGIANIADNNVTLLVSSAEVQS